MVGKYPPVLPNWTGCPAGESVVSFGAHGYVDLAAGSRIFRRVREHVADRLRQSCRVSEDEETGGGRDQLEAMIALFGERSDHLDGRLDDGSELRAVLREVHFPPRDA